LQAVFVRDQQAQRVHNEAVRTQQSMDDGGIPVIFRRTMIDRLCNSNTFPQCVEEIVKYLQAVKPELNADFSSDFRTLEAEKQAKEAKTTKIASVASVSGPKAAATPAPAPPSAALTRADSLTARFAALGFSVPAVHSRRHSFVIFTYHDHVHAAPSPR
jgi:hypothetical protein